MVAMPDQQLLNRIRIEFLEMPGLQLTPAQLQRLCGVDRTVCQQVLATLVATKFLCLRPNGTYARLTDGADYLGGGFVKRAVRASDRTSPRH
jgi:DNA-binding GntR family transcriptional regulator